MNVFISGGCKNGKSMYAQNIARDMSQRQNVPLYYIATMIPADDEDRARIRRHLSERDGWGFETIEQGRHICDALKAAASADGSRNCPKAADAPVQKAADAPAQDAAAAQTQEAADASVNGTADVQGKGDAAVKVNPEGAFLLDSVTALLSNEMFLPDGTVDFGAGERVAEELVRFAQQTGNTVFVSDYIYSDGQVFDSYTESYRKALAFIDRRLAEVCDSVIEVSFGHIYEYK